MSEPVRVLLIGLLVSIAVFGAVAGGAYWWWQHNRDALIADSRSAIADGLRFARGKDQEACVREAATRAKGAGMTAGLKGQVFLTSCLRVARPVAGFCNDVPAPNEILKSGSWIQQRGADYGLSSFEAPFVLPAIQQFCHR